MIKKIAIVGGILAIILISVGISLSGNDTQNEPASESEPQIEVEADVVMPTKVSRPGCEEDDRCYIPSKITINKGEQVTWINEDSAFHSVTSGFYDAPTDLFDSGHMDPFDVYVLTFDDEGTFDYFCTLHPWMEGQVIVE